eukprot:5494757-Prymnesium_polylepis.1
MRANSAWNFRESVANLREPVANLCELAQTPRLRREFRECRRGLQLARCVAPTYTVHCSGI